MVVTEYRREPGLDILVPGTMTDWYASGNIRRLEGRRDLHYRRFQVAADWSVSDRTSVEPAGSPLAARTPAPRAAAAQPPSDPTLAALLDKAGEHVLSYERALREVVGEEQYEEKQTDGERPSPGGPLRGRLHAAVPGPLPWLALRDALEADGRLIRPTAGRLASLFAESPESSPPDRRRDGARGRPRARPGCPQFPTLRWRSCIPTTGWASSSSARGGRPGRGRGRRGCLRGAGAAHVEPSRRRSGCPRHR